MGANPDETGMRGADPHLAAAEPLTEGAVRRFRSRVSARQAAGKPGPREEELARIAALRSRL